MTTLGLTSFVVPSNRLYLSGTVYSDDPKIADQLVGLYIFVKADNEIITGDYVDTAGHYDISFIPGDQTSFDFYVTTLGIDTTFLKSFIQFDSDKMTWDIKLPNEPKKKLGGVFCPKCTKTDKVYPIIYGDNQVVQQKVVNGDTTYTNIVDKKYYAGTCVHYLLSPNWYCDREKIKF
ncbi:MAG: hypothetical protein H6595_08335 [Flavobacteriales bacterium]|nr:hypothetical protein [Flavobacteriales bacterium]MCB9167473.1 hypothetical protein [Flavobacteriales bacterium]